MCGVAGFIDSSTARNVSDLTATVLAMADKIQHRGPDDRGAWVDPAEGIALGSRRLAIIDLSVEGHQPMQSADGRYVIAFNGEIYNFRALGRELEGHGHRFRGHSDTEVMLAAISQWGLQGALARFNGMFAFALWDRHLRLLCLARDRLGEKPMYYGWMGKTFMFASELKALRTHPDFKAEIARDPLALYMRHNYIPAPYSIYKGVQKLLPASTLTISPADEGKLPPPKPYWSAKEAAERGVSMPFGGSEDDAAEQLDALLRDAVLLRMESDVPLGAFLSGGIDSSMVVFLMQAQSDRPVKTFTIGFVESGYNEAEDAKKVAKFLGTDHTELYVTPDETIAVIPKLPTLYDEPFADSSQIPTFLISELARSHVTVSLSGDGGDEVFGGYDRYHLGSSMWDRVESVPKRFRGAAAKTLTALSPAMWEALYRNLSWLLPARYRNRNPGDRFHGLAKILGSAAPETLYLELVSHWKDPAALVLGASEPPTLISDPSGHVALPDFIRRMMYLDTVTYLPDDILVKVDRASMGVSLEVRVPYLDHRVVEFAWQLPLSMKARNGEGKLLLRQLLHRYVPKEMVDRPKMGFGVPIGAWLRGPLRDWADALLSESRLRNEGYLDPAAIKRKWLEHLSGKRNWDYYLWDVLMFQAWLENQVKSEVS